MHHGTWGIFEILLTGLSLLTLAAYLVAAYRQRICKCSCKRGCERDCKHRWSHWRTASFSSGIIVLLFALLPQTVEFAHHDLRGHMLQHLLLGMVAPLGLVFGAPVLLALRTGPRRFSRGLVRWLRSPFIAFISHPVTALVLNIGGMYLLYLTPLYAAMQESALLHALVHWHFLVAGCLFTWAIAGPEPAPQRPGWRFRLVVMFVAMATHAFLAKAMYAYGWPAGSGHNMEAIQSAAKIMYYGGDLTELVLVIALFAQQARCVVRRRQVWHDRRRAVVQEQAIWDG